MKNDEKKFNIYVEKKEHKYISILKDKEKLKYLLVNFNKLIKIYPEDALSYVNFTLIDSVEAKTAEEAESKYFKKLLDQYYTVIGLNEFPQMRSFLEKLMYNFPQEMLIDQSYFFPALRKTFYQYKRTFMNSNDDDLMKRNFYSFKEFILRECKSNSDVDISFYKIFNQIKNFNFLKAPNAMFKYRKNKIKKIENLNDIMGAFQQEEGVIQLQQNYGPKLYILLINLIYEPKRFLEREFVFDSIEVLIEKGNENNKIYFFQNEEDLQTFMLYYGLNVIMDQQIQTMNPIKLNIKESFHIDFDYVCKINSLIKKLKKTTSYRKGIFDIVSFDEKSNVIIQTQKREKIKINVDRFVNNKKALKKYLKERNIKYSFLSNLIQKGIFKR